MNFFRAITKWNLQRNYEEQKSRGTKDTQRHSSENRTREKEKVNFPLSLLTALSSYLSTSFRGFCPNRRGQHAPRDEKLRDLITGPVFFTKIIARVASFSSTIIFFFSAGRILFNFDCELVHRSRNGTAFIRDFAFVRITKLWSTVFRLEMIRRKKERHTTHSPIGRFLMRFHARYIICEPT